MIKSQSVSCPAAETSNHRAAPLRKRLDLYLPLIPAGVFHTNSYNGWEGAGIQILQVNTGSGVWRRSGCWVSVKEKQNQLSNRLLLCVSTAKLHCAFMAPGEGRERATVTWSQVRVSPLFTAYCWWSVALLPKYCLTFYCHVHCFKVF